MSTAVQPLRDSIRASGTYVRRAATVVRPGASPAASRRGGRVPHTQEGSFHGVGVPELSGRCIQQPTRSRGARVSVLLTSLAKRNKQSNPNHFHHSKKAIAVDFTHDPQVGSYR
jgi:hypothetical protein